MSDKIQKSAEEWKKILKPEVYAVTRGGGTEAPFSGGLLLKNKDKGAYSCACCGQELFSSTDKFESGTGWPSFTSPAHTDRVSEYSDSSHGMKRTEVRCSRCDAHLGHVFTDGPSERGGLRYCINALSLSFHLLD